MKNRKGLSFIELMTVMVVAGLLFGLIVPEVVTYMQNLRVQHYRRNVEAIRDAIERYRRDNRGQRIWVDPDDPSAVGEDGLHRMPVDGEPRIYPPYLDILAEYGYLDSIPLDPFTGEDDWQVRQVGTDPNEYSGGWVNWHPRDTIFPAAQGIIDIRSNDPEPETWEDDPNPPPNKLNWHRNDLVNWYSAPDFNMWAPRGHPGR